MGAVPPKPISILHAPTPLGLKAPAPGRLPGTRRMPEALQAAGLHEAISGRYAGEVVPGAYSPKRDPVLGVLNPHAVHDYSVRLAIHVGNLLANDSFPLVIGGDCSVLLGCALALRRRGRYGLVFLDGHADHLTHETTESGGVAGMDLAVVTGTGIGLLAAIDGLGPYILPTQAVQVGSRDETVQIDGTGRIAGTEIRLVGLEEIRRVGPTEAASTALAIATSSGAEGVWLHVDADVLDDSVMPAVDSRQPGGLEVDELAEVLRLLCHSRALVGMDLTIYDPDLDPGGEAAQALITAIQAGFSARLYS